MPKQIAKLNYLRMAPRKVRAVGQLLKGLTVNEAEAQLIAQRRRAAKPLLKLLRSAVADARNNQRLEADRLYVESLRVDQGPMLKRMLPRARGMATPIQKKMSHVTLVLQDRAEAVTPRFKIVVPKKTKLPPKERPKQKTGIPDSEEAHQAKRGSGGFFKRMFSRKTGVGK